MIFTVDTIRAQRPSYTVIKEYVEIRTRDKICLATDIYRPTHGQAGPAVLIRTPYNKASSSYVRLAQVFAAHGVATLVQDLRGRYLSQGEFHPFSQHEVADGYETLEWMLNQSWFNGDLGLLGISYSSYTAFALAAKGVPAGIRLQAIESLVGFTDPYSFLYHQGALRLHWCLPWHVMFTDTRNQRNLQEYDWHQLYKHLPLCTALQSISLHNQYWQDLVHLDRYNWAWYPLRIDLNQITIPSLHIGGWYDFMLAPTLETYEKLARSQPSAPHCIILGPWDHRSIFFRLLKGARQDIREKHAPMNFGLRACLSLSWILADWMMFWLLPEKREVDLHPAKAHIFVMGVNQWRVLSEWPSTDNSYSKWYFHSKGQAAGPYSDGILSMLPPNEEPPDSYLYDPEEPAPTVGGSVWPFGRLIEPGPADQRLVETRRDVLTYTSEPLCEALEVIGDVRVVLYATSDAQDTDFTAKLVDVLPDGCAQIVQDGILRARYRNSLANTEFLKPGEIYKYEIDLGVTSHVFQRGHRIRIEISSSNFPKFNRNLNTGAPLGCESRFVRAKQTVLHAREFPSHLCLPCCREGDLA